MTENLLVMSSRDDHGDVTITWFVETTATRRDRIASVSRRHVRFEIDELPLGVFDAAHGAHRELHANPHADIRHYLSPHLQMQQELTSEQYEELRARWLKQRLRQGPRRY